MGLLRINPIERVRVGGEEVKGMTILPLKHTRRAPSVSCRHSIPGYDEFVVRHDGTNRYIGPPHTWRTWVVKQPYTYPCTQTRETYQGHHIMIVKIRPDDQIIRISLLLDVFPEQKTGRPFQGIWQEIDFRSPGMAETSSHLRPLVEIG